MTDDLFQGLVIGAIIGGALVAVFLAFIADSWTPEQRALRRRKRLLRQRALPMIEAGVKPAHAWVRAEEEIHNEAMELFQ